MIIVGRNNEDMPITTANENRDAVIALAHQARASINLFSRDLDPRVFDNSRFEQCISRLARKERAADIRILVIDSSMAVSRGHRVIRLAQKLTSSVLIHNPAREHREDFSTFMVVDGVSILHRPRSSSTSYDAVVNFLSPQRADELTEYFNAMWEQSSPDSQVRRLYI